METGTWICYNRMVGSSIDNQEREDKNMANRFSNELSGECMRDVDKVTNALKSAKSRYPGDAHHFGMLKEGLPYVIFETKGGPDIAGAAAVSKIGQVELIYSSEGDQYQKEKALRMENGVITGHRERFVPLEDEAEPWGEWAPVTLEESQTMLARSKAGYIPPAPERDSGIDIKKNEGVELDLSGSM